MSAENKSTQTRFSELTNTSTAIMNELRKRTIYSGDAVAVKYKILGAALWSISARCEPCMAFYAQKAKEFGVTESEFAEFVAIATGMGGCVGETWALKAFAIFQAIDANNSVSESSVSETNSTEQCNC